MHREWRAWALDAAGNGRHRSIAGFAEQPDGVLAASQQSASGRRIFTVLAALCKAPAELVFGKGQLGDGVAGAGSKLRRLEPGQVYHASFWLLLTERPPVRDDQQCGRVKYAASDVHAGEAYRGLRQRRSWRKIMSFGSRAWFARFVSVLFCLSTSVQDVDGILRGKVCFDSGRYDPRAQLRVLDHGEEQVSGSLQGGRASIRILRCDYGM
jgi:hypothetical protein